MPSESCSWQSECYTVHRHGKVWVFPRLIYRNRQEVRICIFFSHLCLWLCGFPGTTWKPPCSSLSVLAARQWDDGRRLHRWPILWSCGWSAGLKNKITFNGHSLPSRINCRLNTSVHHMSSNKPIQRLGLRKALRRKRFDNSPFYWKLVL